MTYLRKLICKYFGHKFKKCEYRHAIRCRCGLEIRQEQLWKWLDESD